MPETPTKPAFLYEAVFKEFQEFAKPILAARSEPAALILVVPWALDAPYPPGAIATRDGNVTPNDLLACAKQLQAMTNRLYELLEKQLIDWAARRVNNAVPMEGRPPASPQTQANQEEEGKKHGTSPAGNEEGTRADTWSGRTTD